MKKILIGLCTVVLALGLTAQDAEAKRLGGGSSKGMQRESVSQKQASPQPATPAQQAAPQPAPHTPATAPAPQPQKRSWLGPIAGLAAGIGLAALLSHFGMGEGVANFLMIALLVMAVIFIVRLLLAKKQASASAPEPMQYAGVGGPNFSPVPEPAPVSAASPAAAPAPQPLRQIPADFDVEGFVRVAKVNFLRLQAANDAGNLEDIREFVTPEMFAEIKMDFTDRAGASQHTDVSVLNAELLEVVSEDARHIASVRFHGTIREDNAAPQPFDEVWHLVKPTDGSRGWAVAGIQQLN